MGWTHNNFFNGKKLCKNINPDEAVAYGAAIQAANLSGEDNKKVRDLVLLDVTPLSLGIELESGIMSVVIPRNTPIPTKWVKTYKAWNDERKTVRIAVYEGERTRTADNNYLGDFVLHGWTIARVKVFFEIDVNGILTVTAEDPVTGRKKMMTFTPESRTMSKNEIGRMIEEATKYKAEDEEHKKTAEARTALEDFVYRIRNFVKEQGYKLAASDKEKMEDAIDQVIKWLDGHKLVRSCIYKTKMEEMEKMWHPIFGIMHRDNEVAMYETSRSFGSSGGK